MDAKAEYNYVKIRLKNPRLGLGKGENQIIRHNTLTTAFRQAVEAYDSAVIMRKADYQGHDGIDIRMTPHHFEHLLMTTRFFRKKVRENYEHIKKGVEEKIQNARPTDVYLEGKKLTTLHMAAVSKGKTSRRINVSYEHTKYEPLWKRYPGTF